MMSNFFSQGCGFSFFPPQSSTPFLLPRPKGVVLTSLPSSYSLPPSKGVVLNVIYLNSTITLLSSFPLTSSPSPLPPHSSPLSLLPVCALVSAPFAIRNLDDGG